MIKVALIVGTRPEAIKMAPVYLELVNRPEFEVVMIVTAQHRSMLDQVLEVFGIKPDFDLDLMRENQTLTEITAGILTKLEPLLIDIAPDAVLVHGDTTTSLAATLAARFKRIPIGHVESGLRTYDFDAPWPEEINRRLVDSICQWCFAPTELAKANLLAERIPDSSITVTGNTVVDALIRAQTIIRRQPEIAEEFDHIDLDGGKMILVTGHRRESFGQPFEEFCKALKDIAATHSDISIVYPVHLNPNVQRPVMEILSGADRVHLIDPMPYLSFVYLMSKCDLIITDSGGVQEEAPTFGKPVLVTRETTERPEAMQAGLAKLVGMNRKKIVEEASILLSDSTAYSAMSNVENPYGDGKASRRIATILAEDFASR